MKTLSYIIILIPILFLGSPLAAQSDCDPANAPQNAISTVFAGLGVQLSWDSVESSLGCQFKVTIPSGGVVTKITPAGSNSFNIPQGLLSPGIYTWKVRCACSLSPLSATPFSDVDTFEIIAPDCGTISDIDANLYGTVQIGTQCWMKENLRTSHYADGTALVDGTGAGYIYGDYATKYYFSYDDDPLNANTYGHLYTWAAVMNSTASSNSIPSGVQGPCPDGWHIPSIAEWDILANFLGGISVSGGAMKTSGTIEGGNGLWFAPNTGATNSSGFSCLPGGYRFNTGGFVSKGYSSFFWSSTENDPSYAWHLGLLYNAQYVSRPVITKDYGYSVRCVQDPILRQGFKSTRDRNHKVEIYPNPAEEFLIIQGSVEDPSQTIIELTDISGRLILIKNINALDNFSETLDINHLESGIYLYRIRNAQEIYTGRFVKK